MLSPSSTDDEPTSIRRMLRDFSSKMSDSDLGRPCKQKLSFCQSVLSEEDESSFSLESKRSRFHDPLSSSIGRKRFASERARELSSLEEENASLKQQLSSLKEQNIADKTALSKLSTVQRHGELASKRYLLEARSEANELRSKYEKELLHVKSLQEEIRALGANKENRLFKENEESERLKKALAVYEKQVTELRQECFKGKKALESANEQRNNIKHKLESENVTLNHRVRCLELEKKEWEENHARVEEKSRLSSKLEGEMEALNGEILKKDIELRELRDELVQNKEALIQRNAMRQQLAEYPRLLKQVEALKNENGLLHQTQENVELLKEKMYSLEEELRHSQERLSENLQGQFELHRLQKVLKSWESVVKRVFMREDDSGHNIGPEFLSIKLAELQRTELQLRSDLGEALTDKKVVESRIGNLEESLQKVEANKGKSIELSEDQAKRIKKLQRKLILLVKERDSYKSLLESYEHEVTFAGGQIEKDKVSMLESILADHKEMISKLEEQLGGSSQEISSAMGTELCENVAQKSDLEGKICSLRKELESAVNERDHLRYELDNRAIKGDYNPHTTRVIQFKNNPMAEASENVGNKINKLQDENQALKVRIKLMEEGQMRDLTLLSNQKVEEGISPKEVEDLRNKVKSSEKKNERLMDAFKKTSKDFRKLAQELTGYRISSDSGDHFYRVTSIYADSPSEEQLFFKRDEKGEMLLLQNDYAETMGDLIKVHLTNQDSIPAFLAGLTLDLMSKQGYEGEASATAVHYQEEEPICID